MSYTSTFHLDAEAPKRLRSVRAFDFTTTPMPEFTAPGIGRESTLVTVEAEFGDMASGVLCTLGGVRSRNHLRQQKVALAPARS